MCSIKRILIVTGTVALLLAAVLPASAQEQARTVATSNQVQAPLLESRWLPWLGCWELTADVIDYRMVDSTGRRVVCVAPRLDGRGVNLTTQIEGRVIAENTVIADGSARILPEADCNGQQTASWSADGRRLHSSVSATCAENSKRSLIGLSMLVEAGRWIELQSVSFDGGEHRELVIREYQRLDNTETRELGFATLDPALAARAATARAAAAAPLDIDDILEAWEIFPVEIVEGAILESNSMFALDTNALVRLDDAGVEGRVIDLMVAISFPDKFVVDNGASSGGGGGYGGGGYGGYGGGYGGFYNAYPSCWGMYYSPFYGPYGPGCVGNYYPSYFGGYSPPYYGPGGGSRPPTQVPPSGSLYGGKVFNNRGYSVSRTPVNLPSSSGTGTSLGSSGSLATSGALGYTVRRAFRRNDNGGNGGSRVSGASRFSGNSRSSVSRSGGFSQSGSSAGSSAGSSSGTSGATRSAKAKAKPKGGGGS